MAQRQHATTDLIALRLSDLPRKARARHNQTGRPLVTVTYAQSLDGSIAACRGQTLEISGPESKRFTHQLRAHHDAILIGIETVLADDPHLTTRHTAGPNPQPVILDSTGRLPLTSRLFQHPTRRPWVAVAEALEAERVAPMVAQGAQIIRLPCHADGRLDLPSLVDWLGGQGIASLMVEGGSRVISSFLEAGLADLLILTIAPILVGGLHGLKLPVAQAKHPRRLKQADIQPLGEDWIVWGEMK